MTKPSVVSYVIHFSSLFAFLSQFFDRAMSHFLFPFLFFLSFLSFSSLYFIICSFFLFVFFSLSFLIFVLFYFFQLIQPDFWVPKLKATNTLRNLYLIGISKDTSPFFINIIIFACSSTTHSLCIFVCFLVLLLIWFPIVMMRIDRTFKT
jgi:hypothetical protein